MRVSVGQARAQPVTRTSLADAMFTREQCKVTRRWCAC